LESQRHTNNDTHNNTDTARHDDDSDVENLDTTYDDGLRDDLPPNASISDLVGKVKEIGTFLFEISKQPRGFKSAA